MTATCDCWPRVSVIVPTGASRHHWHRELLRTVQAQSYPGLVDLWILAGTASFAPSSRSRSGFPSSTGARSPSSCRSPTSTEARTSPSPAPCATPGDASAWWATRLRSSSIACTAITSRNARAAPSASDGRRRRQAAPLGVRLARRAHEKPGPVGVRDLQVAQHLDAKARRARAGKEGLILLFDPRARPALVRPLGTRVHDQVEHARRGSWAPYALAPREKLGKDRAQDDERPTRNERHAKPRARHG